MAIDPQFVGLVQILLGTVSLLFLKPVADNRDAAGSFGFTALCIGVGIYGLAAGLNNFVFDYGLSVAIFTVKSFGGILITSAWLLLALEVTDRITVTRRVRAGFAGYVTAAQLFVWTDPIHALVLGPDSGLVGPAFDADIGVGLWFVLGIGYLATFLGTALLATDGLRSTGLRRRQRAVLSLAILPPLAGSLVTVSGPVLYDYTPLGYALTAAMFAWALFGSRFLDLTPVARRTVLGEMSDAVVTLDDGNRVVDCNQRARELFDVGDDYTGQHAADFFSAVVAELEALDDVVETETEIAIRTEDQPRHFGLSVSPVTRRGQRGRVVVLRDITDRKRREQELERQNERLDRFASMVGHDLRNPLTVAAGQLALAQDKTESDAVADHLDAVERSHERMDDMVEHLLTLARSGQRVAATESVALAPLAREAWSHAEVGDASLELTVPEDVTIAADADRLLHVFENLFRNAVEHGSTSPGSQARQDAEAHGSPSPDSQARQDATEHDGGPVTVRVGLLSDTGDGRLGFFIEDDGEGIPPDERDRVFEDGYTTGESGTGLGLFIVRDIVDAHDWDVRVTEGTDGGARFEVTGVEPGDG